MTSKKLLIICDSHGTDWGCTGYASRLKDILPPQWDVTILAYPGISLKKIHYYLLKEELEQFDSIVLGVGNPDVHPRIPKAVISKLKKLGVKSARDSYFSVPPIINPSYLARLPFFIFRMFAIRFKTETYASTDELKELTSQTIQLLINRTSNLYILPLFKVNSLAYGKTHSANADEINEYIRITHPSYLIEDPYITENTYRKFRNFDFFHFKNEYQIILSRIIEKKVITGQSRKTNIASPFKKTTSE